MPLRSLSLWRGIQRFNVGVSVVACLWCGAGALLNGMDHFRYSGHRVAAAAFTPDGRLLLGVGSLVTPTASQGEVTVWDASTGRRLWSRADSLPLGTVAVSPDGRTIASGVTSDRPAGSESGGGSVGFINQVRLWDARSGRPGAVMSSSPWNTGLVQLSFAAGGRLLMGVFDDRIAVWDTHTGEETAALERILNRRFSWAALLPNPRYAIVAVTDDAGEASILEEFDLQNQYRRRSFGIGMDLSASLSPDGTRLVTADPADRSFSLWDLRLADGSASLRPLDPSIGRVRSVRFSPDGNSVIVSSAGNREDTFAVGANGSRPAQSVGYGMSSLNPRYISADRSATGWGSDSPPRPPIILSGDGLAGAQIDDGVPTLSRLHAGGWSPVPLAWKTGW